MKTKGSQMEHLCNGLLRPVYHRLCWVLSTNSALFNKFRAATVQMSVGRSRIDLIIITDQKVITLYVYTS